MKKLLIIIIALGLTNCTLTPREEILLGAVGGAVGGGVGASVTNINLATGALIGYVIGGGYQTIRHSVPNLPPEYLEQVENACVMVPEKEFAPEKVLIGTFSGAIAGGGAGAAIGGVNMATGAIIGAGVGTIYQAFRRPTRDVAKCRRNTLDVTFARPSAWNGVKIPGHQVCQKNGGNGSTPPLVIKKLPKYTNAIIVEFNNLDNIYLSHNGGKGKVGFYHDGSPTAWLLPVAGETNNLPPYAFRVEGHRARDSRGTTYMPPCSSGNNHLYVAEVFAVHRSGDAHNERTIILAKGSIVLGRY